MNQLVDTYSKNLTGSNMSYKDLKNWRSRTKLRIIDAMGGKCVCCGYNTHYSALELHHIDPSKKKFNIGGIRANAVSWSTIVQELKKCVLLCANCHREVESGVRSLPEDHASFDDNFTDYNIFKPLAVCPVCSEKFRQGKTRQIYCSRDCYIVKKNEKSPRPSREKLDALLQTMSFEAVGRLYGVTGNSVRKWLKKYSRGFTPTRIVP